MDRETGNSMGQDAADAELEAEIASAWVRFAGARTPAARREAFAEAGALQGRRSAAKVRQLESARGLAPAAGVTAR